MDIALFSNFGLAGIFLGLLFTGLATGRIYTRVSVDKICAMYDKIIENKEKQIEDLISANQDLHKRNELLAGRIGNVIEVSRTQGMMEVLPNKVAEKVVSE